MSKELVGIDISDYSIEAVSLQKRHGGYKSSSYSRIRLSPDIVRDGQIIDHDRLIEAIKILFSNAKPSPLQPKSIALSIPESKVFSVIVAVPDAIKEKDLPAAIASKAAELIPESPDQLVAAWREVDRKKGFVESLYVAARKDVVEEYSKLFTTLGYDIDLITTEAISSYAGLHPDHKKDLTLLLDIGSRTTIATIFDQHSIRDSINIGIAGNDITQSLQTKMGISFDEAEEKKLHDGMEAEVGDGQMMLVAQGTLQPVVDELKKFISYFEQDTGQKLQQLVLIGGTAQMKGIENYFGSNLNLPCVVGKSFLTEVSEKDLVESPKFINAIGLARLGNEKAQIDFRYEKGAEKKTKTKKHFALGIWKWLAPVAIVLAIGILGYFFRDKYFGTYIATSQQLSGDIVVGIVPPENPDNFIKGVYQDINVDYVGQYPDLSYQDAVFSLQKDAEVVFLAEVNNKYKVDGYYLIPRVISAQLTTVSQIPENYDPTVDLNIVVQFRVMSLSIDDARFLLSQGLSTEERTRAADWTVKNSQFSLLDYNQSQNTYSIRADIGIAQ